MPYLRRFLYANGMESLYPAELPRQLFLGRTRESGRHFALEEQERSAHTYICGITGSGKTRFLENMLVQDIARRQPLCLIDPTGSLYRKALDFIAYCAGVAANKGHHLEELLADFLFLDLNEPSNPLRFNPLEPGTETTEEQVDDLLKVAERLFGSVDEMRRLRNTLRSTLWVIAELNRLGRKSALPFRDSLIP